MRILHFILLFLFWITAFNIFGQEPQCHRSTEGTDFWFGFMEGRNLHFDSHYIEITVTASEATSFSISIGNSATPYFSGPISANSSVQIKINPRDLAETTGSETVQKKGIHLVAENPVNVYALNWDESSADVAIIYPANSLGTKYFAMCYEPSVHNDVNHGRNSEFLIVASEDSTIVTITPSVVTDFGRPAKVPFNTPVMNKGDVYQVQSLNRKDLAGQGDLTGSFIESNKPVALYSGNLSATVPVETNMSGYDHLYEQMPPLQTWGREFYAVPLKTRQADKYRVMASEDNTTIYIGNNIPVIKNRGEFEEFTLNYNQPSRIFADKPIMVAQFSQSNRTDYNYTGGNGDPFMIILSPISQSKNEATFVAYDSDQIENYYINIITLTSQKGNIELDGNKLSELFRPFVGTDYSYTQITTFSGRHIIKNLDPDMGFLAYVYGYGGYESYGYGVGFNLDLTLDLGQSLNFEGDTFPVCSGQSVVLDAGPNFDSYLWNTGETTQKITVTKEGLYRAYGNTTDDCKQSDSIYILVANPEKPNIGPDMIGCGLSLLLNAGADYARYEWNTGELTPVIEANQTGEFTVLVYDKYGCYKSDTMNLTVFPVPTITMIGEKLLCGVTSRSLNLQFDGVEESIIQNGTMEWNSDKPGKLTFSNKSNISTDITVTDWGNYIVYYTFTTPDGCPVRDTFLLRFAETPTSKIEFADEDPNDKCKGYNRDIIYIGNATPNASYYWNFGGCQADSINWNLYKVSLGVYNSNPVVSLVVEENGCWSDTSRLAIGANPDFAMNTTKSRDCDSATIQFSGELKTPDKLLFEWDFGDNSPISSLQEPSHFYSSTGNYDVGLVITNQLNGCKVGYTIDEMVKIFPTPEVEIVVDPAFCNEKTIDVYYLQNNDSSFCTWDFIGASEIGNGNDSITVLLETQIATIRLQVEEYGCISDWAEATAKRKPIFDFTTDLIEGCQPLQVLAKASTSDGNIEFKWITDTLITIGDEQYFTLPDAENYDFILTANSAPTGCSDTLIKHDLVQVHPKPLTQFEVDYSVAIIEHANLHFTNLTHEVEIFNWDFGDGYNSTEENPQHTYTALGKFPVELIAESEFGCIDTGMMEVEILPFNVYTPNAFRPDSDIPENREFMPVGSGVDPNTFQMHIYNRWGELIFESNSPDQKWDGKTKNSNPAPVGNYIWKADFADIQGFKHSIKGQIMLIR